MYVPQVNDYVIWNKEKGIQGWVYFMDDAYITIEVCVRPKDGINYEACSLHRNERLLVLCYHDQWKELTYVRSRTSIYEKTKNLVEMVG
jgi:hypothetical protein